MLSLVQRAQEIRKRLQSPPNAVADTPIDLKRKKTIIRITQLDTPQKVPVNSWDTFGPKTPSLDDLAFGPVLDPVIPERKFHVTIPEIQRFIAKRYGITRADILSSRRTAHLILPRHVAMHLSKRLTLNSLPTIGRLFGNRDHTTALHAVRKIQAMREADAEFDGRLREFERQLVAFEGQTEGAPCSLQQKQTSTAR